MAVPDLHLNDGRTIPQFGLGLYQVPPAQAVETAAVALRAGYRHIDTAQMYGNEKQVGEAVARSGIDRGDIFVTTKLNNGNHRPDDARRSFDQSLADLGFGYVDLFLIHWPLPTRYDGDFVSTWRVLEELCASGRARSIGVSNFNPHHLCPLLEECEVVPAVNQIEVHPYFTQDDVRAFCAENQIAVEAWAPIARGAIAGDQQIQAIAAKTGRTPAQVVLRWHIQRGDIVFPKSVAPERIRQNIEVFDFELPDEDMVVITALNRNERIGPDPDTFAG